MATTNQKLMFAIIVAMSFVLGYCQVPSPGKCPDNIKTVADFNVDKYLGKWYEHSKYPFVFEIGGKCTYAVYGKFENGSVSVLNTQINSLTGKRSSIEGTADTTDESGKLLVRFSSMPSFVGKSNYWVLATDYTSYSLVYSCSEHFKNSLHTTIVWILTRERNPAKEVIEQAYKVIDEYKISKTYLMNTNQEDCPNDEHQ